MSQLRCWKSHASFANLQTFDPPNIPYTPED